MARLWELPNWDNGTKVRLPDWPNDAYLVRGAGMWLSGRGYVGVSDYPIDTILRDDWELYEEPKPKRKVKMYPAVLLYRRPEGFIYELTNELFDNKIAAEQRHAHAFIRLATELGVEVEVDQ